jgi:non-heme chloroperoxidase
MLVCFSRLPAAMLPLLVLLPASAQPPEPWRDPVNHAVQLVTVEPGVQLEVLDWGGAGRAVVLLAGAGNTAHVFDRFAPKLASHCHVYGITRRGYGGSTRPTTGYDEPRLAEDILHALDALGIAAPVLAGHSMAGGEITILARTHPHRISALVYLDGLGDPRDWPGSDPAYMALARKLPPPATPPPPAGKDWPESELHMVFDFNPDGTRGAFKTPSAIFRAMGEGQTRRNYTGLDVPVLALYEFPRRAGDPKRIEATPPRDAAEAAAVDAFNAATIAYVDRWVANLMTGVSDVHLIDMPGAGHYIFLSRESQVLQAVQSFLTTLH